jgi:hypothetical protein
MSRKLLGFTLLPCALFVLGAAATPVPSPAPKADSMAEAFWKCPSGYAFQVNGGNAVNCKKAAYTAQKPYVPCSGATPTTKIDLVGTTDMCAGTGVIGTVTLEPICNPTDVTNGYTKRHVAGTDFCGKYIPASIIAPNQQVTR